MNNIRRKSTMTISEDGLNKNQANFAALSPLSFLERHDLGSTEGRIEKLVGKAGGLP